MFYTERHLFPKLPKKHFLLALNHHQVFEQGILGIQGREPTAQEKDQIIAYKNLVYRSLVYAVEVKKASRENVGVIADDVYGSQVLWEAKKAGYLTGLSVQKSDSSFFEWEYEDPWVQEGPLTQKIKALRPELICATVRFNAGDSSSQNQEQLKKLRLLSDYCRSLRQHFVLQLIIPPTAKQLQECGNDMREYEYYEHPAQTFAAVHAVQDADVRPSIWIVEGMPSQRGAESLGDLISGHGRNFVRVLLSGRLDTEKQIRERFFNTERLSYCYFGFAVGRFIFLEALRDLHARKIEEEQALERMSDRYMYCYDFWTPTR